MKKEENLCDKHHLVLKKKLLKESVDFVGMIFKEKKN